MGRLTIVDEARLRELLDIERDRDEQVRLATKLGDQRNAAWGALQDIRDNFDCACGGRGPKCQVCIATVALNGLVPLPDYLKGLERLYPYLAPEDNKDRPQ